MKKISSLIIKFRYVLLILFILLAGFNLFLSTKVNINDNIMEYLPNDSNVKIGKKIMDENFKEIKSSTLSVMFKNLSDTEKEKTLKELENVEGVSSVTYENTEKYNKDGYTLYILNVDDYKDSKTASNIYNYVKDNFSPAGLGGEIFDANKPILQISVATAAVIFALIILVILSESYLEPFLYFIAIGIAIFINKGTNIMFSSVSVVTDSIAAILQLALSMDYSIMLSNRYKQEKQKTSNKLKAMKEALYQSFKSISSSSVTTIVGLLALVFMSFTIGRDLGFVLAKGVLLSLICIFFCLPALLLLFDKLIEKTHKKSPKFNLEKLGRFTYKLRYVELILILIVFVGAYLLKGNINILYTSSELDTVGKIFPNNNQMALVYKNDNEKLISSLCQDLEKDSNIEQVLCYSNTLNQKLSYQNINSKFSELGQDTKIDESLLKIIYYNYYKKDSMPEISLNDLINFVNNDVVNNKDFNKNINKATISELNKLTNFTDKNSFNKEKTIDEISNILNINKDDVKNILIYYNSKNKNTTISLKNFVSFLLNDIANNSIYSSYLDKDSLLKLKQLEKFTNEANIQKSMNSQELSNLFGIDEKLIDSLFLFGETLKDNTTKLTLNEYSTFALYLASQSEYSALFSDEMLNSLNFLKTLTDEENINIKLDQISMKYTLENLNFSLDDSLLNLIYTSYNEISLKELINFLLTNEQVSANLTPEQLTSLQKIQLIMNNSTNTFDYKEISALTQVDETLNKTLYNVYDYTKVEHHLTPLEFTNFIIENKNNELLKNNLDNTTLNQLYLVKEVMTNTLNNKKYSSNDLSSLLNIDKNTCALILSIYSTSDSQKMTLYNFVQFINKDVLNSSMYSKNFDDTAKAKIKTIYQIMNDSKNNQKYSKEKTYQTLNQLDTIDKSMIDLVYLYYGSINNYNKNWKLTIEEIINYLNTDIITDTNFKTFLDKDIKTKIKEAKTTVDESKDLLVSNKYSRMILNTKYSSEGEDTYKFINKLNSKIENKKDIYLVSDSAMAVEMNKTFNNELNKITILTMIFIFLVVAVTFKDLIIPFMLVLIIQTAVYVTMSFISLTGGSVYFISLLIVQAILMGATIDYAIVYTAYYKESRLTMNIKDSVINAYNKSIHTIISSSLILIIVTLIVANFASAMAAKICKTISQGTFVSVLLILFILPGVLAATDRFICRKERKMNKLSQR